MIRPELKGLPCGLNSMMEKQPQMSLAMQAPRKCSTSGPSIRHMIAGLVSIDRPCSAYSGKTTRSVVDMLRRALPTRSQMRLVCRPRSSGVTTVGFWNCTSPVPTPSGDLLRPPRPLMASSAGWFSGGGAKRVPARSLANARDERHGRSLVGAGAHFLAEAVDGGLGGL